MRKATLVGTLVGTLALGLGIGDADAGVVIRLGGACVCIGSTGFCDGKCNLVPSKPLPENAAIVIGEETFSDVTVHVIDADGWSKIVRVENADGKILLSDRIPLESIAVIDRESGYEAPLSGFIDQSPNQ